MQAHEDAHIFPLDVTEFVGIITMTKQIQNNIDTTQHHDDFLLMSL